jgi:hypothetical protein
MKRRLLLLSAFFFALMLVGCKPNEKTFSAVGVTIKLNKSFVEKEVIQVPFYLESRDHLFMASRESKTELSTYGITTLDSYIQAVLDNANKTTTVQTYDEDDIFYKYAYYTSIVNDQTFGYMLLVMEGENHFYTMNFGSLEKNLEGNKDLYFKWAQSITVE